MTDSQKTVFATGIPGKTCRRYPFAAAKYDGKTIRYYCLATPFVSGTEERGMMEKSGGKVCGMEYSFGVEIPMEEYGVLVAMGNEETMVPSVSISRRRTEDLLLRMVRGCVTPSLVRDVVDDWLAE